jgi:tripartite-type tricarboxylate transporter receptor subunit TctC
MATAQRDVSPGLRAARMARRALLRTLAVGLAALTVSNVAQAQYPDRPIKLILPFPGGEGEAVARLIAPSLGQHLGQPVVVESRPGAAGNIAAGFVSRAPADGYTLLMGFSTIFEINPLLYRNLGFDPAQLAPVSLVAETQFVLVVNPSVPARTVQELIAYAKANPGKLNFASAGVGSPLHLAGELFQSRAGVKFLHVPYKGGGEAASAVLGGHADVLFGTISTSMANVQAGRLRALGVTGERRFAAYPDLPTIAESGVPGYNVTAWHSLALPAGTTPAIVARINEAVVKTLAEPDVRQGLERAGVIPGATTPAEVSRRIDTESKLWKSVIERAGITPE